VQNFVVIGQTNNNNNHLLEMLDSMVNMIQAHAVTTSLTRKTEQNSSGEESTLFMTTMHQSLSLSSYTGAWWTFLAVFIHAR